MTKVAVIGGGAAGIGAAETLRNAGMDVVIFEAAPRIGGNCLGVAVPGEDGEVHYVDAGVSDFNRTTFREVARLIDGLGLPTQPICEDTSFASPAGETLWSCQSGRWNFREPIADTEGLLDEMVRFSTQAMEVLEDGRFADWSVERYLDSIGASEEFRRVYFYPRAIGCFPMPDDRPENFRIRSLVEFWNIHGIVSREPRNRHCVVGGMHRYVAAFANRFLAGGGEIRCRTRVIGVVRNPWGVTVRTVDAQDRHRSERVDHVVLAGNAHDVQPVLESPTECEQHALGRFSYQGAHLVVHQDGRVLGDDPSAWGAFNYVVPRGGLPRVRPTITFYPNCLGRLPAEVPDVFATMNPAMAPSPDKVLVDRFFLHPVFTSRTQEGIDLVQRIQGRNRTWFAGSYLAPPFVHESALGSGIDAARRLIREESVPQRVPAHVRRLMRQAI